MYTKLQTLLVYDYKHGRRWRRALNRFFNVSLTHCILQYLSAYAIQSLSKFVICLAFGRRNIDFAHITVHDVHGSNQHVGRVGVHAKCRPGWTLARPATHSRIGTPRPLKIPFWSMNCTQNCIPGTFRVAAGVTFALVTAVGDLPVNDHLPGWNNNYSHFCYRLVHPSCVRHREQCIRVTFFFDMHLVDPLVIWHKHVLAGILAYKIQTVPLTRCTKVSYFSWIWIK